MATKSCPPSSLRCAKLRSKCSSKKHRRVLRVVSPPAPARHKRRPTRRFAAWILADWRRILGPWLAANATRVGPLRGRRDVDRDDDGDGSIAPLSLTVGPISDDCKLFRAYGCGIIFLFFWVAKSQPSGPTPTKPPQVVSFVLPLTSTLKQNIDAEIMRQDCSPTLPNEVRTAWWPCVLCQGFLSSRLYPVAAVGQGQEKPLL